MFRMKRMKQNKLKHKSQSEKSQGTVLNSSSDIKFVPDKTTEDKEHFFSPSMRSFLNACDQHEIEEYDNGPASDMCKANDFNKINMEESTPILETQPRVVTNMERSAPISESPTQIVAGRTEMVSEAVTPTDTPICSTMTSSRQSTKLPSEELGYFEKKYKEIVKITRLQNYDGTVSEEKQVVTVKTERRNPCKAELISHKSTDSYSPDGGRGGGGKGSYKVCTGGCGLRKNNSAAKSNSKQAPRSKSQDTNKSKPMGDPNFRQCMSAGSIKTENHTPSLASSKISTITLPTPTKDSESKSINSTICYSPKMDSVHDDELGSVRVASNFDCPKSKSSVNTRYQPTSTQTCSLEFCMQKLQDNCVSCTGITQSSKATTSNAPTKLLKRDRYTSTTELNVVPSKMPSNGVQNERYCKFASEDEQKETNSSTLKNIPKPTKTCRNNHKKCEEIVMTSSLLDTIKKQFVSPVITSSLLDTIKKLFVSPTISFHKPVTIGEQNNICKSCDRLMKLGQMLADNSRLSSESPSTCKLCQTISEKEPEPDIIVGPCVSCKSYPLMGEGKAKKCPVCLKYCGADMQRKSEKEIKCHDCQSKNMSRSESCASCRNMATDAKPVTPSPSVKYTRQHTCCSSKSKEKEEDESNYGLNQIRPSGQSNVRCLPKPCCQHRSCPSIKLLLSVSKHSQTSDRRPAMKDAYTLSKKSSKFDVRPAKISVIKVREICSCQELMLKKKKLMLRSKSFDDFVC